MLSGQRNWLPGAGLNNKPFIEPEDTEKLWPVLQSIVIVGSKNWRTISGEQMKTVSFLCCGLAPEASYPSQWQAIC